MPNRRPRRVLALFGGLLVTAAVVAAALTVQIVGDHLRSGGSIVNVVPENPREGSVEAAIKAAVSDWTAGQAAHFGTRGITVNAVASGRSAPNTTPWAPAAAAARMSSAITATSPAS